MTPSPVRTVANLLAQIDDPHLLIQVFDKLFDALAPLVMEALITQLARLLQEALNPPEET